MNILSQSWDVISPVFIWTIGFFFAIRIGRKFGQRLKRSIFLYSWHTIWCIAYLVYSLNNTADSVNYYNLAISSVPEIALGTSAVTWLTYVAASGFALSYLSCFLVYNIIGFCGYVAFDSILLGLTKGKSVVIQSLAGMVILLPSIGFWSSAIGKDSIAFTASCLTLWSIQNLVSRWPCAVLSLGMMLVVRPHVAAFMVLSYASIPFFNGRISLLPRILLLAIAFAAAFVLVPLAANYVGISDILVQGDLDAYISTRQGYNQEGAGGVDISGMPLPMQMLAYLLRPALYEANSPFALLAAFDNLLLFVILVFALCGVLKGRMRQFRAPSIFCILFVTLSWITFSMTTANLGIAIRQKWMFLPMLIYIAFALSGRPVSKTVLNTYSASCSRPED
jgi:hypothetical protein